MPKRLILVLKGWVNSLIELVKGIFWVVLNPLQTFDRIFQLFIGALGLVKKPHRISGFLRESPYEPYKAMTTMAVVGAVGLIGMSFIGVEQGIAVSSIVLSASGIAYLLWRSVEFFHGNESTADGIDGFILVTEMLPIIGGIAVISRLVRMESLIARVEGSIARTGRVAGRTSKGVSASSRTASKSSRMFSGTSKATRTSSRTSKAVRASSTKSVESVVQPTVSVGEWANHWINTGDRLSKRFFNSVKDVGKRFRK